MSYKPKTKFGNFFAEELRKLAMDEKEIDKAVEDAEEEMIAKGKDGEMEKKEEKAMDDKDIVAADPYMNKEDDKGSIAGLSLDEVNKMIDKAIKDYDASCAAKEKGMDEAIGIYSAKFGRPNIAFDSVDAVYDAILVSAGVDFKGCSTLEKKGMAKMVSINSNKVAQDRNVVVGDKAIGKSDFNYLSDYMKKLLGVK
jgi:hypothetical protein